MSAERLEFETVSKAFRMVAPEAAQAASRFFVQVEDSLSRRALNLIERGSGRIGATMLKDAAVTLPDCAPYAQFWRDAGGQFGHAAIRTTRDVYGDRRVFELERPAPIANLEEFGIVSKLSQERRNYLPERGFNTGARSTVVTAGNRNGLLGHAFGESLGLNPATPPTIISKEFSKPSFISQTPRTSLLFGRERAEILVSTPVKGMMVNDSTELVSRTAQVKRIVDNDTHFTIENENGLFDESNGMTSISGRFLPIAGLTVRKSDDAITFLRARLDDNNELWKALEEENVKPFLMFTKKGFVF